MFERYFSKNVQNGEAIVAIVKRHPVALLLPLSAHVIALVLDFFFMPLLFRQASWGGLVFAVVFVIASSGIWRSFFVWSLNAFVLTNQRLLDFDQRGFFHRVVSATSYDKIQDVSYSTNGVWQSLFQIGTIHVQTAGGQANLELYSVGRPEKTVELINKIMRQQPAPAQPPVQTQEFVTMVSKMRRTLGDQAVDELVDRSRDTETSADKDDGGRT